MADDPKRKILIVANRTAATPVLLEAVDARADEQATAFVLLIPNVTSRKAADWTLKEALTALNKAARGPTGHRPAQVQGRLGGRDAFESIQDALAADAYDEVIISTLPKRTSEWLRRDLPRRVRTLGVPVTVITPPGKDRMKLEDVGMAMSGPS